MLDDAMSRLESIETSGTVEAAAARAFDLREDLSLVARRLRAEHAAARPAPQPWQCPEGVLHLYEVVVDEKCVAAIKRLTEQPEKNLADLRSFAGDYRLRDGGSIAGFSARPGELIRVACTKCGREAIACIGWDFGATEEAPQ